MRVCRAVLRLFAVFDTNMSHLLRNQSVQEVERVSVGQQLESLSIVADCLEIPVGRDSLYDDTGIAAIFLQNIHCLVGMQPQLVVPLQEGSKALLCEDWEIVVPYSHVMTQQLSSAQVDDLPRLQPNLLFEASGRLSVADVDANAGCHVEHSVHVDRLAQNAADLLRAIDVNIIWPFDVHVNAIHPLQLLDCLTHHQGIQILDHSNIFISLQGTVIGEHHAANGRDPGIRSSTPSLRLNVSRANNVLVVAAIGFDKGLGAVQRVRVHQNDIITIGPQMLEKV